ncbi:SsrA-binding protein [Sediminispirochaeta smaragdinae DSM 11293]|uniref:SsrA-binding protein n=2 Tax=Sediminispirochaeta TaxID=1911556 RepID=E1R1J0_SEDSS|nr:SsrA-binding protein [Sediminispirochaeta smaragdinae DSM 11293]
MVYPFPRISSDHCGKTDGSVTEKKEHMDDNGIKQLANNRKARFLYTIEETLECGIELKGTEVKSLRTGKFSFTDAYGKIERGQFYLCGLHISPYAFGNIYNHDPDRNRRLLAHKREIEKLRRKVDEKGFTLVPLRFYLKHGRVKVEMGLGKGKKLHDKRDAIKQRDLRRDADRDIRDR